jgi:hypothetical protein
MGIVRNAWAVVVSTIAVVLIGGMAMTVPRAYAARSCTNEARRIEQASAFLPDCRAYELVSQPYQPTPATIPFLAPSGIPVVGNTEFSKNTDYSPEPRRLPSVQVNAFVALDGHAVLYKGEEPNNEAWETESALNLSQRTSEGWAGENIFPHESAHSGFGCKGTTEEGISPSLEYVAVRLGGGGKGSEDYEHCGHDEPYLFSIAEGGSRETGNLALRDDASGSWSLVSIYTPGVTVFDPGAAGNEEFGQYLPVFDAVSADGSHAVFTSQAQLTTDAPNGETVRARGSVEGHCPAEFGNVYVWSAGSDRLLTIPSDGIPVRGTLAGARPGGSVKQGCIRTPETVNFTNSVAANGERILFYAGGGFEMEPGEIEEQPGPRAPYVDGGLYLREHPGAAQSELARGGAAGTGALTSGSNEVSTLRATLAAGVGHVQSGSDEITELATLTGRFAQGQTVEGHGIPAGTTVAEIIEKTVVVGYENGAKSTESIPVVVLSNQATESLSDDKLTAVSEGPAPFAAGQTITGRGISAGTTITAVEAGKLTLSNNATASGSAVAIEAFSECAEAQAACTMQIDVPEAGASGAPGGGQFQWADAETTKIFFTDQEKFTTDSTAEAGKPDLYEYDTEKPAGQRLTDLTANAAEAADVLGVAGVSDDGSYVYFVARGVLAQNENTHHDKAQAGQANLYLRHAGETTFIATLNAEGGDQCDWTAWCLTSRVSQNGGYLAFDSIDSLTGYDNHPVKPTACSYLTAPSAGSTEEAPCIEAYRYASANGAHGELTCATCNPAGRPKAEFAWALVRQAYREGPANAYGYQIGIDHPISNLGQFFFETEEKLVPADENGEGHNSTDVYEYSGGEGESAQYHLISTGDSGTDSEFIDATPDGSNVFFSTAQPLLNADTRRGYDIFDARVNGGLRSQSDVTQRPFCEEPAEACLPPLPGGPAQLFAGSATLFGSGNLPPAVEKPANKLTHRQQLERTLQACKKRYRHKPRRRQRCERQAGKRYGAGERRGQSGRKGRAGK